MTRKVSTWLQAIRLPTLTASVIPVTLGGMLAYNAHAVKIYSFFLSVIAMTFFQITSNLINDVDDFKNRVDTKESLGSSRVIVDALLTQKQVMTAAIIFFVIALVIGVYLAVISGIFILLLGFLGAASAYFYTRKPFCFKYKGYGVPLVFLMFGPLPVLGSYYVSVGSFSLTPVLLSIPVGLLTTAILHANDLRDIAHDKKAGIKSFAIVLGTKYAQLFYTLLLAASFVSVLLLIVFAQLAIWSLIVFLSAPVAFILIHRMNSLEKMKSLDHKTAGLQLVFGILLLVSLIL